MMEKLKTQNSKLKTKCTNSKLYALIFIFALCTLHFTLPVIKPVYALDSTPSADIKSKLEELKKEIASKAAQLKQEVNRKLRDKAYVGKIKLKSETSLTLATDSGPKVASLNQDTVWESKIKSKTKFSSKNNLLEDYVVALGDTDETGVLIARKIILLPPSSQKPKTFLWSQIISISDKLITLKTSDLKNAAAILPASPKVKLNDFVILTGSKDNNDILNADFVYVIPQGGIIKPKKIATPSATLKASPPAKISSPSAKPKTTPKPINR